MSLLFGMHDREGALAVPNGGWCLDTIALSENPAPTNYDPRINWLVRANWGYGSTGTIPLPENDRLYFDRIAHYVHNSQGVHAYIIGNETNHENERPNGVYITPQRYADFFVRARTLIKTINSSHRVIPAPCAPYHANPVDWLEYWREMLNLIAANGGCDGIAVHAYTRSSNPADIQSGAKMGPPLEKQYSGFYTYKDALDAVPLSLGDPPAYITEFNELLEGGWDDANTGVVQAAYADIDTYNQRNHGPDPDSLPVQCLVLYRWPKHDRYFIEGKQGVIDDYKAAVAKGYQSPPVTRATTMPETTFIPSVSTGTQSPALPPRDIDPRAALRGVTIETPNMAPGRQFWFAKRIQWLDEQESQGRHHILGNVYKSGAKLAGVPLIVNWPSGSARILTEDKSKDPPPFDYWYNYPMSPSLTEYSIKVDGLVLTETVKGIGMGADGNSHVHTSTVVEWELATMPGEAKPPVKPTEPAQPPTEPQPTPKDTGIIDPRVGQAIIKVESGGQSVNGNGTPIIRFESHIFGQQLNYADPFFQHFKLNEAKPWTEQEWRADANGAWQPIHTGKQADEYAAFELAKTLNPDAAYNSISIGAPQIMGFNHARIGYPTAEAMFNSFESAMMQIIGFLNFCLSDPALAQAMRDKDWREIAKRYNGAGAVDTYAPLLEKTYNELGAA